jgi:two-component system OmpR family response regulator
MRKVLLIEEDSSLADSITEQLGDRGMVVECSSNGIEGLDKARSHPPDVMIIDRMLPGMDGLVVIEALRRDQVRIPVLVLSALNSVEERARGLNMGGDDYLAKPFAAAELFARIESLLRRPAHTDEVILRV